MTAPPLPPTAAEAEPPFLDPDPPPMLARRLATLAIAGFVLATVALVTVRVPESVRGRFRLMPAGGADPVRAPRAGVVARVAATEAAEVRRGAPLVELRSAPIGDEIAELRALEAERASAPVSLADLRARTEDARRADEAEVARLEGLQQSLAQAIASKRRQLQILQELEAKAEQGVESGATRGVDFASLRLNVARVGDELAAAERQLADARSGLERLRYGMSARASEAREAERRLRLESARAEGRVRALRAALAAASGDRLVVGAPCDGTVLRLRVRAAGAVVQEGEELAEVACREGGLVGEMQLPADGVARVSAGQPVRLLFDAFPYQRYGIREGVVRWAGPAGVPGAEREALAFRAIVTLADSVIVVDGAGRPLVAGMGGEARIITGRRTLAEFALEPLRRLREAAR
ncbi:MAG: HlyD family efflux transporter periplasmic adaptor subunit [Gemmatimonadales bacterium]|nr:HlyD family efflux transporter periplasmic adaptor subunit [Gemmatimonadales bacterium]